MTAVGMSEPTRAYLTQCIFARRPTDAGARRTAWVGPYLPLRPALRSRFDLGFVICIKSGRGESSRFVPTSDRLNRVRNY
jgi:hypothetical protein